jgi:hypothetical protein
VPVVEELDLLPPPQAATLRERPTTSSRANAERRNMDLLGERQRA